MLLLFCLPTIKCNIISNFVGIVVVSDQLSLILSLLSLLLLLLLLLLLSSSSSSFLLPHWLNIDLSLSLLLLMSVYLPDPTSWPDPTWPDLFSIPSAEERWLRLHSTKSIDISDGYWWWWLGDKDWSIIERFNNIGKKTERNGKIGCMYVFYKDS